MGDEPVTSNKELLRRLLFKTLKSSLIEAFGSESIAAANFEDSEFNKKIEGIVTWVIDLTLIEVCNWVDVATDRALDDLIETEKG